MSGGGGDRELAFSFEEVKHCMHKMVEAAFENPQNIARLKESKSRAGSDMVKIMQFVFPIAIKIQQETMEQCGFHSDYEGKQRFHLLQNIKHVINTKCKNISIMVIIKLYLVPLHEQ